MVLQVTRVEDFSPQDEVDTLGKVQCLPITCLILQKQKQEQVVSSSQLTSPTHFTRLTGEKLIKYLSVSPLWMRGHTCVPELNATSLSMMHVSAQVSGAPGCSGSADEKRGESIDLGEAEEQSSSSIEEQPGAV